MKGVICKRWVGAESAIFSLTGEGPFLFRAKVRVVTVGHI